jgi:tetratricopeptide (TPR) repeat protein
MSAHARFCARARRLAGVLGFGVAAVSAPAIASGQTDSAAIARCKAVSQLFVAGDTAPSVAAASAWAGRSAIQARLGGCPSVAVNLYEMAAQREPAASVVWLTDAAQLLVEQLGHADSAILIVQRASAARPADDELLRLLAKVQEAGQHWPDAHCSWARVLVVADPHDPDAWAGLARVAFRSGQPREAVADWQRLQLVAPNYLPSDTAAAALYDHARAAVGAVQPANEWLVLQDARRCAGGS